MNYQTIMFGLKFSTKSQRIQIDFQIIYYNSNTSTTLLIPSLIEYDGFLQNKKNGSKWLYHSSQIFDSFSISCSYFYDSLLILAGFFLRLTALQTIKTSVGLLGTCLKIFFFFFSFYSTFFDYSFAQSSSSWFSSLFFFGLPRGLPPPLRLIFLLTFWPFFLPLLPGYESVRSKSLSNSSRPELLASYSDSCSSQSFPFRSPPKQTLFFSQNQSLSIFPLIKSFILAPRLARKLIVLMAASYGGLSSDYYWSTYWADNDYMLPESYCSKCSQECSESSAKHSLSDYFLPNYFCLGFPIKMFIVRQFIQSIKSSFYH